MNNLTEKEKKDIYLQSSGKIVVFLKAISNNITADKPENRGKVIEYTCPLCGGTVRCSRSEYHGHVHARCRGCGFGVME